MRHIVLTADRIDSNRQLCRAGTRIAPDVEGWPAHRVDLAVRHGYASVLDEQRSEPATVAPEPVQVMEPKEVEPSLTRRERKKKKHEGAHGL